MQIFVKTLTGEAITLDVEPFDTYRSIKERLREILGETRVFPLILDGMALPDEQAINSIIVWGCSTLYYFNALPHYEVIFNREGTPSLWSFVSFPTKEEEEEERGIFLKFIESSGFKII